MSEMMQCTRCGEILPRSKLERMKTGTYRRVCNHCKWLYYVKPSRERRILERPKNLESGEKCCTFATANQAMLQGGKVPT